MSNPQVTATELPVESSRDWRTPIELTILGAIWGASFMFMRVAAPEFGPFALVEMRLGLGALVLLPFLWRGREHFPLNRWPILALIGAINSAVPFILFAWAAERAPAGIGAICNAMTVLFTALVASAFFGERIGTRRGIALVVGFVGVLVLASAKVAGASVGWAVAAGTLAALLYGFGANMVRKYLTGTPPAAVAASTLGCAALLVMPLAVTHWPETSPSTYAWFSAALLGVLCTGIAFVMFYQLIKRVGAPRAVIVTYIVPLFGVFWAWLLLDEPVTWAMALAGTLIVGSVVMSQKR